MRQPRRGDKIKMLPGAGTDTLRVGAVEGEDSPGQWFVTDAEWGDGFTVEAGGKDGEWNQIAFGADGSVIR